MEVLLFYLLLTKLNLQNANLEFDYPIEIYCNIIKEPIVHLSIIRYNLYWGLVISTTELLSKNLFLKLDLGVLANSNITNT